MKAIVRFQKASGGTDIYVDVSKIVTITPGLSAGVTQLNFSNEWGVAVTRDIEDAIDDIQAAMEQAASA